MNEVDPASLQWRALSQDALQDTARALGALLVPGDLVLLCGAMGAGKTTWTRALAQGLAVDRPDRVRSPTFNICVQHDGPRPLAHVDLFRLTEGFGGDGFAGAAAFEALGLSALVDDPARPWVVVVEWGELWQEPPLAHLRVTIAMADAEAWDDATPRDVHAQAYGARHQTRLQQWQRASPAR